MKLITLTYMRFNPNVMTEIDVISYFKTILSNFNNLLTCEHDPITKKSNSEETMRIQKRI